MKTSHHGSGATLLALVLSIALQSNPAHAASSPSARYRQAAKYILRVSKLKGKGYCVVYGAEKGQLAYELAKLSKLTIVGVGEDAKRIQAGRRALDRKKLYGTRVALHQGSLDKLPYSDYAGVLVVSDSIMSEGVCKGSAAEMFRMVRPDGGMAIIGQPAGWPKKLNPVAFKSWLNAGGFKYKISSGRNGLWALVLRGPLPGAGEWTHQWGDLGNTACSGDERITSEMSPLWYGAPGPRVLVERHARSMPALYKRGRLVIPGAHRVTCVDAYNGARLWDIEFQDSSRINIPRDAGWVALGGPYVYVAFGGECRKLDAATGELQATFTTSGKAGGQKKTSLGGKQSKVQQLRLTPKPKKSVSQQQEKSASSSVAWGYLAIDNNLLFGSKQARSASQRMGTGGNWWRRSHGESLPMATSKSLFCLDARTGVKLWEYKKNGVIANPAICIGTYALYLLESRSSAAGGARDGRVTPKIFLEGKSESLVKLDKKTGREIWRKQVNFKFEHVMYLSYANDVILASGCRTGSGVYMYDYHAFNANDGTALWTKSLKGHGKLGDAHGHQDKHPIIVDNNVFNRHGSFNLKTGEDIGFKWGTSNCSDYSASKSHVFVRGGGRARMQALPGHSGSRPLSDHIRPGCYISIIPAGGLIMLPPASSGCTCAYGIQTTVVWLPESTDQPGSNK